MLITRRHGLLIALFVLLVVFPVISYLAVKQGKTTRENVQPSSLLTHSGIFLPDTAFISQRGDTLTVETLQQKVLILEFFTSGSDTLVNERHPLFEIQEAYQGKTTNLRIISALIDSSSSQTDQLSYFASRFAVRYFWHIVAFEEGLMEPFRVFNEKLPENNRVRNLLFPNTVFLFDKHGEMRALYNLHDDVQFDALYTDVLYLLDE